MYEVVLKILKFYIPVKERRRGKKIPNEFNVNITFRNCGRDIMHDISLCTSNGVAALITHCVLEKLPVRKTLA